MILKPEKYSAGCSVCGSHKELVSREVLGCDQCRKELNNRLSIWVYYKSYGRDDDKEPEQFDFCSWKCLTSFVRALSLLALDYIELPSLTMNDVDKGQSLFDFMALVKDVVSTPVKTVVVAKEFSPRLINRDRWQGNGFNTGAEFRHRFLKEFDNAAAWEDPGLSITLDFKGVKKISPSFANEAFAYFTRFVSANLIRKRIEFVNISKVQRLIIEEELEAGYKAVDSDV